MKKKLSQMTFEEYKKYRETEEKKLFKNKYSYSLNGRLASIKKKGK